jgi:hypothetical protein
LDSGVIEVYLNDERFDNYDRARLHFIDAAIWAVKHCKSFAGYEIMDVADNSLVWDQVAEYKFKDARDVTLFKLTWA